jgi:hypothetical protein
MIIITKLKENYYVSGPKDNHGPFSKTGLTACLKWYYKIPSEQFNIALSVFYIGKNDMAIFSNDGQYIKSQHSNYSKGIIK